MKCRSILESHRSNDFAYCDCGDVYLYGGREKMGYDWRSGGPQNENVRIIEDCSGNKVNEPLAGEPAHNVDLFKFVQDV